MKVQVIWLIVLVVLGYRPTSLRADEKDSDEVGRQYHEAFNNWAKEYQIIEGQKTTLKVREKPLLHWTNPVRNSENGSTFVWTDDGNPIAIGSFFTFNYKGIKSRHEFHSLHDGPLTATFREQKAWLPKEPGIQWTVIKDAPRAADSRPRRLLQIRQIARNFQVTITPPKHLNKKKSDLRQLSQPVLRFQSKKYKITDGAVFSFVIATDPEALLLVRLRDVADQPTWEYAFARFHYWALEARHKDKVVWTAKEDLTQLPNELGNPDKINEVFISFFPEPDHTFKP